MADFCKQCSEELFGEDFGDLAFKQSDLPATVTTLHCLCEGCGFECVVTENGTCVSETCLKQHGKQASMQDDIAMQECELATFFDNDLDQHDYNPLV